MQARGLDIVSHRKRMNESQSLLDEKFKDPDDPLRLVAFCKGPSDLADQPIEFITKRRRPIAQHANSYWQPFPKRNALDRLLVIRQLHVSSVAREIGTGTVDFLKCISIRSGEQFGLTSAANGARVSAPTHVGGYRLIRIQSRCE